MEYTHSITITFKNGEKKIISSTYNTALELQDRLQYGMLQDYKGTLNIGGIENKENFMSARIVDIQTIVITKI